MFSLLLSVFSFDLLVSSTDFHFLFYKTVTLAYWKRNYWFHFNKYWTKHFLESTGSKNISEIPTLSCKSLPFTGGWKSVLKLRNYTVSGKREMVQVLWVREMVFSWPGGSGDAWREQQRLWSTLKGKCATGQNVREREMHWEVQAKVSEKPGIFMTL